MLTAISVQDWIEARNRNPDRAQRIENLCMQLSSLWPRDGSAEHKIKVVSKSETYHELLKELLHLPEAVRPTSSRPAVIIAWAELIASRLARRSL